MNKKGNLLTGMGKFLPIIMFIGFLILILFVFFPNVLSISLSGTAPSWSIKLGSASIIGSGEYIERPVFYYDKCEAISDFKYSTPSSIASGGLWLIKPSVSSSYNVQLKMGEHASYKRFRYSVCNSRVQSTSNCRIFNQIEEVQKGQAIQINNIKNNEYLWVVSEYWALTFQWKSFSSQDTTYSIGWTPYGIRSYNVLGGSPNIIDGGDCTYNNAQTDTILSTDSNKIKNVITSQSSNQNTLQPEEVRWYIAGYLTSVAESFVLKYNNQDAWCRQTGDNAEIYKINKITTSGGTYKIASPDWSDKLGNERCCPKAIKGDLVCNDKFSWIQIAGNQCGAFNSCGSPNWVPNTATQLIKYSCVNGYCKSEIKDVECASDLACVNSNEICDLNTFTCVQANVNLNGQLIIPTPDNLVDCQKAGGQWVQETTEKKSLWNRLGFGEPKVVVKEYCDMSKTNWILWILIIAGIILIYIFIGRPILKGTPVGRYLP